MQPDVAGHAARLRQGAVEASPVGPQGDAEELCGRAVGELAEEAQVDRLPVVLGKRYKHRLAGEACLGGRPQAGVVVGCAAAVAVFCGLAVQPGVADLHRRPAGVASHGRLGPVEQRGVAGAQPVEDQQEGELRRILRQRPVAQHVVGGEDRDVAVGGVAELVAEPLGLVGHSLRKTDDVPVYYTSRAAGTPGDRVGL